MASFLQIPLGRMFPLIKHFVKPTQPVYSTETTAQTPGPDSFYQLSSQLQTGQNFSFANLKGKQVLLVNTAANAADSIQYRELQQLAEQFADKLVVLTFPTNDFTEATNAPVPLARPASAGVPLHLMQPSVVIKAAQQHPVFQWLSSARQNGWNEQAPPRNFTKYLVDSGGHLAHYFGPTLSPLSETVIDSINNPAS